MWNWRQSPAQRFTAGELAIEVDSGGVYLINAHGECEPLSEQTAELLHAKLGEYLEGRKAEKEKGARGARE
jgi:hypothetical protein